MATVIRADTEQLRAVARQMRATADQIVAETATMRGAMDGLAAGWSGSASERGLARWDQSWPRYQPAADQLGHLADELDGLATRLDDAAQQFGGGSGTTTVGAGGTTSGPPLSGNIPAASVPTDSTDAAPPQSIQDLAARVSKLYDGTGSDGRPLEIVQTGPNDYLVMMAGTEVSEGGNNWGSSFQSGMGLPSAFERQARDLINQNIPPGASINFAAHSLGGIVANNLADNQDFKDRYKVNSVTTFGSPESAHENPGTTYTRYAALGDVVPAFVGAGMVPLINGNPMGILPIGQSYAAQIQVGDEIKSPRPAHSSYATAPGLAQAPLPFQINQWQPVGQYAATNTDSLSLVVDGLTSGDPIGIASAVIDAPYEAAKTYALGSVKYQTDNAISLLPQGARDATDRYLDRFYSGMVDELTLTESVGEVVDMAGRSANAAGGFFTGWLP